MELLGLNWVSLDIRGKWSCLVPVEVIKVISWASNEVHWTAFWKIMFFLNWGKTEEGVEVGRGKRGKILFPQLLFFQKLFFCSWNKLHKYVTHMEDTATVMRARQKSIFSVMTSTCWGRKANPAWLWFLCITPSCWIDSGSWSNFYCHEGAVDSHLKSFSGCTIIFCFSSIYWMYMGLHSHLVSSLNYYSHSVISWGRVTKSWTWRRRLTCTHTHIHTTHRWKYFPKCVIIFSHPSSVNGYIISSRDLPGTLCRNDTPLFSHTLVINFLITLINIWNKFYV